MQIDDKTFVVDSMISLTAFLAFIKSLFGSGQYITFTWRIGADRSLDQNALFYLWLAEWAGHFSGLPRKKVPKQMVEFLKRKVKQRYYNETGYSWMLDKLVDPQTGEDAGIHYASSKDYKVGEMHLVLTWMQMTAAEENGLVLESMGQFSKFQRQQQGVAA